MSVTALRRLIQRQQAQIAVLQQGGGSQGPAGTDGKTITAGAGTPSGSANVGDLYIDTETGDLYRWTA